MNPEALKIYKILKREYPAANTALDHQNVFQLLVATILSSQCTDARVNKVTPILFKKYKTIKDFAKVHNEKLEQDIRSTGFYRNKAKNIIITSNKILSDYNGIVPDTMEELTSLAGVARKTANIILFHAYGKNEGIAVDTHVKRLSGRLGFTQHTNPEKIEKDLMRIFEKKEWGNLSNLLIAHGRKTCKARKPDCNGCIINKMCSSFGKC